MAAEQVPMKEFTLTSVIRDFSQLPNREFFGSPEVHHCNVPWEIEYGRCEDYFSLALICTEKEENKEWSIDTKINMFIIGSDGTWHSESLNGQFRNGTNFREIGLNKFYSIANIENKILAKDELFVEINVQVLSMRGIGEKERLKCFDDDEAKMLSDVTLLVDNRRFYVSKITLANQCKFFKSLFFGDMKEANESEITLKDINADAFQAFLEVIHLEPTLTDSCVEDVIRLADMYDSKHVMRLCENFIFGDSELSTKEKFFIGIRFNLKPFIKRCIEGLFSPAHVRSVMQTGDSENDIQDPEVLSALLEKLLSFN